MLGLKFKYNKFWYILNILIWVLFFVLPLVFAFVVGSKLEKVGLKYYLMKIWEGNNKSNY